MNWVYRSSDWPDPSVDCPASRLHICCGDSTSRDRGTGSGQGRRREVQGRFTRDHAGDADD